MRSILAALFTSAALAATAAAAQDATRNVSGELTYLQRIALPDDAFVVLELRDTGGKLLTEERFATEGRQVPLEFTLSAPAETEAVLKSAIFTAGLPAWVSEAQTIEPGTEDVALPPILLTPYHPMGFATAFRCGETELSVGYIGDNARLRVGARYFDLEPVEAASGAKFADPADEGTFVWSKGNDMLVSVNGEQLPECAPILSETAAPAPFRAWGHEPSWNVTVTGSQFVFMTDFGQTVVEATLPEPEVTHEGRRYDMAEAGMVLTVTDAICHDIAVGLPHPATVALETGDQVLQGCGGAPLALLTGVEWQVETIGGDALAENTTVTLYFDKDGTVSGSAGCNRFFASFTLSGEGLAIGHAGSTMMACDGPVMEQERQFLNTLGSVSLFDISEDGGLVLQAQGAPVITARP